MLLVFFVPALARFLQPIENVFDCIFLIVLERKLHGSTPHRETEVVEIGFVEPHRLDMFGQAADNGLKTALVVSDDVGKP